MTTHRATPNLGGDDEFEDEDERGPRKVAEHRFLARLPTEVWDDVKWAADREGLPINHWAIRVLFEAAARAKTEGWLSTPVEVTKERAVEPEPEPPLLDLTPVTKSITFSPDLTSYPTVVAFDPPDDDVPAF